MPAPASLDGVGRQEDLVGLAAGEPRPIAVVAIRGPLVPRLAAVDRREERIVDEVDARVVDAPARILGQVGVAEPGVLRRARRTRTTEVAVAEPVGAAVRRRPDVDLVAVVGDEGKIAPGRGDHPVSVEMGRPFVGGVDQRSVLGVCEDFRLAPGELLVDVDGRREGRPWRDGRTSSRQDAGERGQSQHDAHRQDPDPPQARKRLHQMSSSLGNCAGEARARITSGHYPGRRNRNLPRAADERRAGSGQCVSYAKRNRAGRATNPGRAGAPRLPRKASTSKEDLCLERRFAYFCSLC